MKTTILGRTGLAVSRVGLGGISIQRCSEDEAVRVVQRCLDLGVTFLDTANGYTTSEERIGQAIRGRRDRVVLATKTMARDREKAESHLVLSLLRLGVDYIDLWQLHNVSDPGAYPCEDRCPYRLPIREMIRENVAYCEQAVAR